MPDSLPKALVPSRSGVPPKEPSPAVQRRPGVLFVTDELFLPRPHNGSADVYIRAAQDHARRGRDVFCISFFRDRRRANDPELAAAYAALFADFLLLPGWNGGGTLVGRAGIGWREVTRWITGNIFVGNRLLEASLRPRLREVVRFTREHPVDTIYLQKPQTAQMLLPVLPALQPAQLVLELHDDFVERGVQYQRAYKSFHASVGAAVIGKYYWRPWLRMKFYRVDARRSRAAEARILARCDRVIVASEDEYRRYRHRGLFVDKLACEPWRPEFRRRGRTLTAAAEFDAGFVASDDVMNLDAVTWFCREIMPRVRRARPDFRFLVAGTIARSAARLLRGIEAVHVWVTLDDVATFYEAIKVAAVPLRYGTGTSIKVHEALAFGRPIVSTRVGVRGIPPDELTGVWIADDRDGFSIGLVEQLRGRGRNEQSP